MSSLATQADVCSVCKEPVKGGFEVFDNQSDELWTLSVVGTPDRNFNVCDVCNATICYSCSACPESGYCNECYRMVRDAQAVDDLEEAHEETNQHSDMENDPMILTTSPEDDAATLSDRVEAVKKVLRQRIVDIRDFQARVTGLCDLLTEIANEMETNVVALDGAIMDVLTLAKSKAQVQSAIEHFD